MQDTIFFLGRFHVLALHLPIGMLFASIAVDWLARSAERRELAATVPFLWGVTALSAVLTVALGYMHFAEGGFTGPSAAAHRLYGTLVAVACLGAWLLSAMRPRLHRRLNVVIGLGLLGLVTLTGHYGGNLTHGSEYLVEYAPQPLRALAGLDARRAPVTELPLADPWRDIVQPMLEARCATCHNDDKREAGFSIESWESTLAGGETGTAVVPGNADLSEIYRRVSLPHDDEAFMPAEGKTPLTAEQVAILRWWIESGAPIDTTVAEVGIEPDVERLLAVELGLSEAAPAAKAAQGTTPADAALVARLYDAGFLVRQVSQSDARLIVSIYSAGSTVDRTQLTVLAEAAPRIAHLDLQGAGIGDTELEVLRGLANVVSLRLSNNRIGDAGVAELAALPAVEYLNLYGNAGVTDGAIDALAAMQSLADLYLWETSVSTEGLERLRMRRPDLRVQAGTATLMLPPVQAAAID